MARLALVIFLAGCGARTDLARLDPDAGGRDATRPECSRDEHCDDGLECTDDRCDLHLCVHETRDERCDDGLFCTGPGRCDAGLGCVFDRDPCNDRVDCTEDLCDERLRRCAPEPRSDRCPLSHRCDEERGCLATAIVHTRAFLWNVDLPSGELRRLGPSDVALTDVALHPDGRLFGISSRALFSLDEEAGTATFIATLRERSVALDVMPDGDLVAAGVTSVIRIDPESGASERLASFPPGLGASGDIAFVRGRMLVATTDSPGLPTSSPDFLYEVPLDGGPAFEIGVIGFACVWGLAPFGDTLYGFTCDGRLLEIDPVTGRGRQIADLGTLEIGGAAAR